MRLLKANTDGSFSLTSFTEQIPPYAILSHRWEQPGGQEVTYNDLTGGVDQAIRKLGCKKIQFCSKQAKQDNLDYFWVDSCSIDKSSSAELSEALNSMFRWYQNAAKCYVYLSDVSTTVGKRERSSQLLWESAYDRSQWFTRGWTLQELLAPSSVEFFSREGTKLGDKRSLENRIHNITGIEVKVLRGCSLQQLSVEERMSWAKNRDTTREEDQAYSLMGIFDVFLPVLYGEGRKNAIKRLQEAIDNKDQGLKCLQALRTSDYEQFKDRNPDRLDGTCQWFLRHNHFLEWQKNGSSNVLWLSADPGCGKSVLARSLVNREIKTTESRTICYFFFKDDNDDQRSVTVALSALLHQLFSQKRSLTQLALPDYRSDGDKLPHLFHKLWRILIQATADTNAGEVVCILDALDECAESGRHQIIDALNTFYKQTSTSKAGSQLKFLVTSRPYIDIERRFADLTRNFPTIWLRGEMESKTISCEIDIVIKSKVPELAQWLHLDKSEQSILQDELLAKEHRTYLWLRLIVDVINDEIGLTKKKLKNIINTLPATVDQAYEGILSKAKDPKKTRKLLHIIVAATRPLTLSEMNIALNIEDDHRSYEDIDLETEIRFQTTIRNLCGLFVSIVDQKIYLIHQTAKEFLIAESQTITGQWKNTLNPAKSDLVMARACITYLMFTVFDDDFSVLGNDGYLSAKASHALIESHTFFNYAASFWASHFRQSQSRATKELCLSATQICDAQSSRFRNWFSLCWTNLHDRDIQIPDFSSLITASYFGHEITVKQLLEAKADVDLKDTQNGQTPLSYAAENGHGAVVKQLLATGKADVESKDVYGETPLAKAAKNGHEVVVELLLATGQIDVDSEDNCDRTPLFWAAMCGHEVVLKLLLETGKFDVEAKGERGKTPLSCAARNGNEAIVKLLLATGKVDVDAKDSLDRTPLSYAAENGHETMVELLLVTGKVNIDANDIYDQTPLLFAAGKGHEGVVELLLETGKANVNVEAKRIFLEAPPSPCQGPREGDEGMVKGDNGRTALSRAAQRGYESVVKLLLATGKVDVDAKDVYGRTALWWAAESGHEAIVKLLLATDKADVDTKGRYDQTPLSRAAWRGCEGVVKLLLATGKVDVNAKSRYGRTPLWLAAGNGHEAIVKLLLATGKVDVESKDIFGEALSWAARNGQEGMVKLLLGVGTVDVDAIDRSGRTPLWRAAKNGHEGTVKLLLATGKVDVDTKNKYGQTPFSCAAENGCEVVVKLLLATSKVDVDTKDEYGRTPLSCAAENRREAVVKLLLETGKSDVNSKDYYGQTPLSSVCGTEYEVGWEDEDEVEDEDNWTQLLYVFRSRSEAIVKLLLATRKVDIDSKDQEGLTALLQAAGNGYESIVKLLVEAKADIDSKDNSGRTALSLATENGHEGIVKLLLNAKADVDSRDDSGQMALTKAAGNGHQGVVNILRSVSS